MNQDIIQAHLSFDSNIFSIDTLKRTFYRFSDLCSFDISINDNKNYDVVIYVSKAFSENMDDLTFKIRNEVLDQDLRDSLSKETANIRTLILANAFSNTGLIQG